MNTLEDNGTVLFVPAFDYVGDGTVSAPLYEGGMYPLNDIIDLQAYAQYVESQGGYVRDLNATCSTMGQQGSEVLSSVATIVYTNKHTLESTTQQASILKQGAYLYFTPNLTTNGEYLVEVTTNDGILFRGGLLVDTLTDNLTDSPKQYTEGETSCEPIIDTFTTNTTTSTIEMEKVALEASISLTEGVVSTTVTARDEDTVITTRESSEQTISRDSDSTKTTNTDSQTTIQRDGLYNYISR